MIVGNHRGRGKRCPALVESLETRRLMSVISIADATTTEGTDLNFTVSLDAPVPFNVEVRFAVSAKTAHANRNFLKPLGNSITIPKGLISATIAIPTIDDQIDALDKTLKVRLAPLRGNT